MGILGSLTIIVGAMVVSFVAYLLHSVWHHNKEEKERIRNEIKQAEQALKEAIELYPDDFALHRSMRCALLRLREQL